MSKVDDDVDIPTEKIKEVVNVLSDLKFGFVAIQRFEEAVAMRIAEDVLNAVLFSREILGDPKEDEE